MRKDVGWVFIHLPDCLCLWWTFGLNQSLTLTVKRMLGPGEGLASALARDDDDGGSCRIDLAPAT
ncbi:hypothetical protein ACLOJK_021998 [Asimina triloba]